MDKKRMVIFVSEGDFPPPSKLAEIARNERGRVRLFTEGIIRSDAHNSVDGSIVANGLDSPNLQLVQNHLHFIYSLAYLNSAVYACYNPRTKAAIEFLRNEGLGRKEMGSFKEFMEFVDPSDARSFSPHDIPPDIGDFLGTWGLLDQSIVAATAFIGLKKELNAAGRRGVSPLVKALVKSTIDKLIGEGLLQEGFEDGSFGKIPSSELHGSGVPGYICTVGNASIFFVPDAIADSLKAGLRARSPITLLRNAILALDRLEVMEVNCKSAYLFANRLSFDTALVLLTKSTFHTYDMSDALQRLNSFDLDVKEEEHCLS